MGLDLRYSFLRFASGFWIQVDDLFVGFVVLVCMEYIYDFC